MYKFAIFFKYGYDYYICYYAVTNVANFIVVITVIIYGKDTLPCNERFNLQWFSIKFRPSMICMYNVLTYCGAVNIIHIL